MAKVEIERGPLVGGLLIAVSAVAAIALNSYSRATPPVEKDVLPQAQTAPACCASAGCVTGAKPDCPAHANAD